MGSIFVSHSHSDDAFATELAKWLRERGHASAFTDHLSLHGGEYWEQRLYLELLKSDLVLVVLSDSWTSSKWCFAEFAVASALGKGGKIIPLLLGAAALPSELTALEVIDFKDAHAGFARLADSLQALNLAPWQQGRSPYPGLRPFSKTDSAVFFGREDEVKDTVQRLDSMRRGAQCRLLLLVGDSGSGKSSLVRAGVIPKLSKDSDWQALEPITPDRPFEELARVLASALSAFSQKPDWDWPKVAETLRRASAPESCRAALQLGDDLRHGSGRLDSKILLVIDQFERLLSGRHDPDDTLFLGLLRNLATEPSSPFIVLCVLRSEFLHQLMCGPQLGPIKKEMKGLGPISEEGLERAIREPARIAEGVSFETQLVRELVRESSVGSSGALPLLGYVLKRLWDARRTPSEQIGQRGYEAIGQFGGAIAEAAEACWQSANQSEDEARTLSAAFLSLVESKGDHYLARPVRRNEFSDKTNRVLDLFRAEGLLVSRRDAEDKPTIEVAHEALFRQWQRLANWLKPEKQFLDWRRGLSVHMREFPGETLRGTRFLEAWSWMQRRRAGLSQDERELILSSEQRYQMETAHRLADSATALAQDPIQLPKAAALAAEAMSRYPSARAAQVLRRGLAHLPDPLERFSHEAAINLVAVGANKRWIATASEDGLLKIWMGSPFVCVWQIKRETRFTSIAIDPTQRWVAAANIDGLVQIWELANGSPLASVLGASGFFPRLIAGADGNYLAVLFGMPGAPGVLRMLETKTWATLWEMESVSNAAFHPSGTQGAAVSGNRIRFWFAATAQIFYEFELPASILGLEFHPEFFLVGATTLDERLWLCGMEVHTQNEAIMKPRALNAQILTTSPIAFSHDNCFVAAVCVGFEVGVWRLDDGRQVLSAPAVGLMGIQLAFDTNNVLAVLSAEDESVRFWQVGSSVPLATLEQDGACAVTFIGDAKVLTASHDGAARIWKLPSGNEARWTQNLGMCSELLFSLDGTWLAWIGTHVSDRGKVVLAEMGTVLHLVEVASGRVTISASLESPISAVAFDSGLVAAQCASGTRAWHLNNQVEVTETDRQWPFVAVGANTVEVPHSLPPEIRMRLGDVMAVSADGRWLAATERRAAPTRGRLELNESRRIQVIDLARDLVVARVEHMEPVRLLRFAPDSLSLVSFGYDLRTQFWLIEPNALISQASQRLTNPLSSEEWASHIGDEPYRDIRSVAALHRSAALVSEQHS